MIAALDYWLAVGNDVSSIVRAGDMSFGRCMYIDISGRLGIAPLDTQCNLLHHHKSQCDDIKNLAARVSMAVDQQGGQLMRCAALGLALERLAGEAGSFC